MTATAAMPGAAMRGAAKPGRVHVVGAGLAGLAASVTLADQGQAVILYESGPQAGGRCRSFLDAELGVRIDNGNHLLLSGNAAASAYIERIGALDTFERSAEAAIPFIDINSGEHWAVRPGRGMVPWWVLRAARRVPGTRARDYLEVLRLRSAAPGDTVAAVLPSVVSIRTAGGSGSGVVVSRDGPVKVDAVGTAIHGRPSWDQWGDLTTMAARDAGTMMWSRTSARIRAPGVASRRFVVLRALVFLAIRPA